MDYVKLPKIELHAHLTGSVSRRTLHDIWRRKKDDGETSLQDPLEVMPEGKHDYNIQTFFPLFSSYIYNLLTDAASIREATTAVLRDFRADGVAYLELRTTPRATPLLTAEQYVRTILSAIADFDSTVNSSSSSSGGGDAQQMQMRTRLILSIDRRHDLDTATAIVELAATLQQEQQQQQSDGGGGGGALVVGVDLCGDPTAKPGGAVRLFTPAFARARAAGLGITVHFAEAQASGAPEELDVLLGWAPRRLGHVIWEDERARRAIAERGLCLELCLSCNVQAGMVTGGFAGHHFGYWRGVEGPRISLATDDVGVFGSPLSKEYELAAEHFRLDRQEVCSLARQAIDSIFGSDDDKAWLRSVMWTS